MPEQVLIPANRFYRGRQGLVLLVIETERVQAEIRFDEDEEGQVFPHIYGSLNADAVIGVVPFPPEPDGGFSLPDIPGCYLRGAPVEGYAEEI